MRAGGKNLVSGVVCKGIETAQPTQASEGTKQRFAEMKRKSTITSNDSGKQKSNAQVNRGLVNHNTIYHAKPSKEEKGVILLNKQVSGLKNAAAARKQKRKKSTNQKAEIHYYH